MICDETQYISWDEFSLINSVLRKSFMEIKGGDLTTIQVPVKPIVNQTNIMSDSTSSTTAKLMGKIDTDNETMDNTNELVYKFVTPADPARVLALDAGKPNLGPEAEDSVKAAFSGRHEKLPKQVHRPSWADRRAGAPATEPPRLVAALAGETILDCSTAQVTIATTSTATEPVSGWWRPWESVTRRLHPAIPRPSFKDYNVQRPTPSEYLFQRNNFSTMNHLQPQYLAGTNGTGQWSRVQDLLMTTVQPMMRSEVPPASTYPTTRAPTTSRFVAFTPMRIIRRRGSRIQLEKTATNPTEMGPPPTLERPPPRL